MLRTAPRSNAVIPIPAAILAGSPALLRGLGDLTFCEALKSGQMQYVPPNQQYRDAMIADCKRLGVDVTNAPGLLPPQFVFQAQPAPGDISRPVVNDYYTAYTEAQGKTAEQLLAVNPDADPAAIKTDRVVFQSAGSTVTATGQTETQAATTTLYQPGTTQQPTEEPGERPTTPVLPPAAPWNPSGSQPSGSQPAVVVDPREQFEGGNPVLPPADDREIVGDPRGFFEDIKAALPPSLQDVLTMIQFSAAGIPAWVYIAIAAAAVAWMAARKKGKR